MGTSTKKEIVDHLIWRRKMNFGKAIGCARGILDLNDEVNIKFDPKNDTDITEIERIGKKLLAIAREMRINSDDIKKAIAEGKDK